MRVGPGETFSSVSVDLEDICSSPPAPPLTPPSSPNVHIRESPWEPLELQIDYWQSSRNIEINKSDNKIKQDGKISQKGLFRSIIANPGLSITIHYASKEKKQKSIFFIIVYFKYPLHVIYFSYVAWKEKRKRKGTRNKKSDY